MARLLALLIMFGIAVPAVARAQGPESAAAADCCRQIVSAAVKLKYDPGCSSPQHKTPVTFTPCTTLCIDAPCHKPLVTRYPCGAVCLDDVCHEPVVTAEPCAACGASIGLTGCRCQIEHRACEDECDACGACDCA